MGTRNFERQWKQTGEKQAGNCREKAAAGWRRGGREWRGSQVRAERTGHVSGEVEYREGKTDSELGSAGSVCAGFFYGAVGNVDGAGAGGVVRRHAAGTAGICMDDVVVAVPMLMGNCAAVPLHGPLTGLEMLGWMLAASVMVVLPFVFHRVVSPRLSFFETLPLPVAGVVVKMAAVAWLPAQVVGVRVHGSGAESAAGRTGRGFWHGGCYVCDAVVCGAGGVDVEPGISCPKICDGARRGSPRFMWCFGGTGDAAGERADSRQAPVWVDLPGRRGGV